MSLLRLCFYLLVAVIGLVVLGVFLLHGAAIEGIHAFNRFKTEHAGQIFPQSSHEQKTAAVAETKPAGPSAETAPAVCIVKKGDTATSIAKGYGITADELLKFNKIADARKLQPGQALKIPPKKS